MRLSIYERLLLLKLFHAGLGGLARWIGSATNIDNSPVPSRAAVANVMLCSPPKKIITPPKRLPKSIWQAPMTPDAVPALAPTDFMPPMTELATVKPLLNPNKQHGNAKARTWVMPSDWVTNSAVNDTAHNEQPIIMARSMPNLIK